MTVEFTLNGRQVSAPAEPQTLLLDLLRDHSTWASKVARRFGRLIRFRIDTGAFHPNAAQAILAGNDAVFAVLRTARDGKRVLALTNVSALPQSVSYAATDLGGAARGWLDMLSTRRFEAGSGLLSLRLRPYDVLWLKAD